MGSREPVGCLGSRAGWHLAGTLSVMSYKALVSVILGLGVGLGSGYGYITLRHIQIIENNFTTQNYRFVCLCVHWHF